MRFTLFISAFFLLTACSPKVEERGYIKNSAENVDFKSALVIGQTSKQEVLDKFGSPSAQSSFGAETWYYISSKKEGVAFFKPEVVDQQIADIEFDNSGVVSAVNFYNQSDAQKVALVKRTTPTEGHSLTFIDQTLGNLGRFNRPAGTSTSPRGSHLP
jgi:outer membrane protein assembly factor BamE (lipoprotein component of BamABCDE complex)